LDGFGDGARDFFLLHDGFSARDIDAGWYHFLDGDFFRATFPFERRDFFVDGDALFAWDLALVGLHFVASDGLFNHFRLAWLTRLARLAWLACNLAWFASGSFAGGRSGWGGVAGFGFADRLGAALFLRSR